MRWLELGTEAPGEYAEPLTHLFAKYGEGGVVVEEAGGYNPDEGEGPAPDAPVIIRAYLPFDDTTDDRRAQIDLGLRLINHLQELPPLQERVLEDKEWIHQEFEPIRVGQRLVIAPTGARWDERADDLVIKLDPGLAFGTGHHPTTRMCMALMEKHLLEGMRVMDLGCGSGVLTLAALKLDAGEIVALDVEADAVKATNENLRMNGLAGRAVVAEGSLPHADAPEGYFNLTVANISANILVRKAHEIIASLAPGGMVIGSGLLEERRPEVEEAFRSAGSRICETAVSGDWAALVARRV
ncbi:MAG: 50S ribosomal protein L11 methyltransferase [Chloroflexota bacterium]